MTQKANRGYSFVAWLGIAALFVQVNAIPLDYLLFRLNQQEISQTLCEHKVPHCNGHCYLMKQIAKSATANTEKRAERLGFQSSGPYLASASNVISPLPREERSISYAPIGSLSFGYHTTVHQPPRTV